MGLEYFKRYYSIYKAEVSSNEDPKGLGRLQLVIPQIYGKDVSYKYWAKPRGLYSGKNKGSFIIPDKGDNIWVEFEGGDPKYPVWSYGFWSDGEVPEGATVGNKTIQTGTGHKIELDDDKGLIRITVAEKEFSVTISESGISIVADNISVGTLDESSEPAVLGDTLKSKLDSISDEVGKIAQNTSVLTVGTAFGPSTPPVNASVFTAIKTAIDSLKTTLKEILSKKVTLD